MAFAKKRYVGVIAGKPEGYLLGSWWETSTGVKAVISELIGLTWSVCCFISVEYQSHQEKWGVY